MTLSIAPVAPHQLDDFIRVPFRLYANLPHWIPPLMMERRDALKPGGIPYMRRAETAMWIATRDGRPVGRISAQIDPLALARHPGIGHFGLLAAEDDAETIDLLLVTAEDWLRARGMAQILGPMNLSINEECGLLVDGFDTPPMMMMPHDPPYLGAHLARNGYAKAKDLFAYVLDSASVPEHVHRMVTRPLSGNVRLRMLEWSDYKAEVRRLVEIFNDAWADNWGFVPFEPAEVDVMARQLRPLIDRRLVWFAEVDGVPAAFIVCLPDLNAAIADLDGKLLPFGWAKLLWRLKVRGVPSARVPLMGVRRKYARTVQGAMLPFHLIGKVRDGVNAMGIRKVEISWVLEDNPAMRALAEALCGPPYKTYRLYEKDLRR